MALVLKDPTSEAEALEAGVEAEGEAPILAQCTVDTTGRVVQPSMSKVSLPATQVTTMVTMVAISKTHIIRTVVATQISLSPRQHLHMQSLEVLQMVSVNRHMRIMKVRSLENP